ncbi:sugar phosphate isomerase/epimerase family protein [Phreatobacter stygius]|uniref:Sugar phosphate isomerase/epimerase n=1 Tax=Phreatobacter stygius TaxID=1940610 RepID=A0A4D7B8Q5_9HYPH|nr:sugar phosphate isomerase/epimerase family protein [Phreatobacter stygius]QCI65956.1 sugar phosphate isomerase/epimerase [Phreatobacter stygius]
MTLPRLGAHTFGFAWDRDAEAAFEALAGAGFSTLQLMAAPPHYDPWAADPALQRRLRRLIDRAGIALLALDLASNDVNLASPSRAVVDFAVDAYGRAIDLGADLGARGICVASGRRHALAPQAGDQLLGIYRDAFERILLRARDAGMGVVLENHPNGLLAEMEAIESFLAAGAYDGVSIAYDVANAAAIGEDPSAGLRRLLPHLGIVHLSDAPRGAWRHDPIGSGDIDFSAIGGTIREIGFAGPVVLEIISSRPLDDILAGRDRLLAAGWHFAGQPG